MPERRPDAAARRSPRACRERERSAKVGCRLAMLASDCCNRLQARCFHRHSEARYTGGRAASGRQAGDRQAGGRQAGRSVDDAARYTTNAAGGEAGRLLAGFDWTASGLGPIAAWPETLRICVGLLLESPAPMVLLWGADGIMIYNDAYSAFAGGRHPRLFGAPVLQGWPEAAAFNARVMETVLRGETLSFRGEPLILQRDGVPEPVWLDLDYSPVRDESGRPVGVLAIVAETTGGMLAQGQAALLTQSLRDSEAQFRSLAEALPHHLWLAGPDGALTWFNARVYEYTGAAQGALNGAAWAVMVHPDDLATTGVAWSAAVAQGRLYENEFRLRDADGRYRWYLARAVPVRDQDGRVLRWIGTNTDMHDSREATAALARLNATLEKRVLERTADLADSQNRLRSFYDYSTEYHAMLRACRDGSFVYEDANPALLALYGLTRERVIGQSVDALFGAAGAEINAELTACLRGDGPHRYTQHHGERTLEAVASVIPGDVPRLVVTARDVTDARILEEQLRQAQKMEAVGQLTGGIAHDFNNLLQGIVGSLDLMQKRIDQGRFTELARFAAGAMASANRAAALTHRLLAFSRRQPLDPKPLRVNSLVSSMEDLLGRTIGERIELRLMLDDRLWLTLCDSNQLENALLNLTINARDAMADGGRLTIATANIRLSAAEAAQHREAKPGSYICLSVADTGTGMPPEIARRAFDPFFTTKPIGQGTGLGLSMIYGFARQSNGHARIVSAPGLGTTVQLYLPRHRGPDSAEPSGEPEMARTAGSGEVVLVVEDETVVRQLIVDVLHDLGYRTLQATDGNSGLALLLSDQRIDLLVSDLGLPGLNGRQLVEAGRVRRPGLKVLFMTGYAEKAAAGEAALDPGMAMIPKPFTMETLAARIHEMIAAKPFEQS